jgi:serine/threonine protein kinase
MKTRMTKAEADRVAEVFNGALQISDATEREAFLETACVRDLGTRAAVEQLLSSHSGAEAFFGEGIPGLDSAIETLRGAAGQGSLGASAGTMASLEEMAGTQVGPYKLLQKIGEGGCAVVYMAEQEKPVRRRVAVKIVKLGMDTRNVIARFKAEQQALALMEHPNIARVLDAGATATGRPFFVMELVRGIKLTDYCDENELDLRARLELFIQVCHAVQHAHQKGIIHRDLKPSNLLVTMHDGVPVPKVIDFGIAKATEGKLTDNTFFTAYDQFIGTPAYMSPEQAEMSGLDVDTRSDIYSLGVLLYELLTGRPPFQQQQLISLGLEAMRRTLRETEPRSPSTLLTTMKGDLSAAMAKRRHTESRKLISLLRGDLDWIVMKALEKDRRRRYETADALAQDVARYLHNEPVLACPPSRLYRLQKLVQRNRAVFASGAAVIATLVLGLGTSTWLFFREREARLEQARLRQAAESRQRLSDATLLLSRQQYAEADQLLRAIHAPEAALEYAGVYRALGCWSAINERWDEARARFAILAQIGDPDLAESTLDYLRHAPVLLMAGDRSGYDSLRRSAIARYANTTDPVFAERIVRTACLSPGDSEIMRRLQPLVELAEKSLSQAGMSDDPGLAAWRAAALALMKYRQKDWAGAVAMCKRASAYQFSSIPLNASLDCLLAMAHFRLGQTAEARAELERSRAVIQGHRDDGFNFYWFDWLFATVLLQEATTVVGK